MHHKTHQWVQEGKGKGKRRTQDQLATDNQYQQVERAINILQRLAKTNGTTYCLSLWKNNGEPFRTARAHPAPHPHTHPPHRRTAHAVTCPCLPAHLPAAYPPTCSSARCAVRCVAGCVW